MPLNPSPDPMSSMWAWLAHDLRFYRMKHGLSGEKFGHIIGVTRSTVSRLESGELKIDERQARSLDGAFDTGGHFIRLLTYAKLGHNPDWFKEHIEYEAKASVIKIVEHSVLPGLLQLEAVARHIFTAGGERDVETSVRARMARQEILRRPDPPLLWALLDESVIDRPMGGAALWREQLSRLLELSDLPCVALRVVPKSAGFHLGLEGAFKILTVGDTDIVYTEANGGGRLVMSSEEVRSYGIRYDRIGMEALPPGSTRNLIRKVMESLG